MLTSLLNNYGSPSQGFRHRQSPRLEQSAASVALASVRQPPTYAHDHERVKRHRPEQKHRSLPMLRDALDGALRSRGGLALHLARLLA